MSFCPMEMKVAGSGRDGPFPAYPYVCKHSESCGRILLAEILTTFFSLAQFPLLDIYYSSPLKNDLFLW